LTPDDGEDGTTPVKAAIKSTLLAVLLALAGTAACGGSGNADASLSDASADGGTQTPKIDSFSSSSSSVAAGGIVTLYWRVENAISISITAMPGGIVLVDSNNLVGNTASAPVLQTTVFTLTAVSATAMATQNLTVTAH
jgi:hypothetical protein